MRPPPSLTWLFLLGLMTSVHPALAQSSACVSSVGVNLQLYSACESLASELSHSSLPPDGSTVALGTLVSLTPTTTGPSTSVPLSGVILTSLPSPSTSAVTAVTASSTDSGVLDGGLSSSTSRIFGISSASTSSLATMTSASSPTSMAPSASSTAAAQGASASLTNDGSNNSNHNYRDHVVIPVAVVCTVVPILLLALLLACLLARRRKRRDAAVVPLADEKIGDGSHMMGSHMMSQDATAAGADPGARTNHVYGSNQPYGGHVDHNGFGAGAATGLAAGTGAALAAGAASRHPDHRATATGQHPTLDPAAGRYDPFQGPEYGAGQGVSAPAGPYGTSTTGTHAVSHQPRGAGAVEAGIGAAAASTMKPESRSRSRSSGNPGFSGFGGFRNNRSSPSSRGGQSVAGSVDEKPPTLPKMEPHMGHGTWYEGEDPGKEFDATTRPRATSSVYDSTADPTGNVAGTGGLVAASRAPRASQSGTPRSDSETMGTAAQGPRGSDPFRTPPARVSDPSNLVQGGANAGMTAPVRTSEQYSNATDPSGHTSMSSAETAAPESPADDSLFGPYRPPTPYSDLLMFSDARRRQGNAAYTTPNAVGEVVAGRWSGYTPADGAVQRAELAADAPSRGPLQPTPHPHPQNQSAQVLHYPTEDEARTFDFGGASAAQRDDEFADAQESLAPARAPRPSSIPRKPVGGR